MARMLVRVDAEITDELLSAFPYLTTERQRASTTLVRDVTTRSKLQGIISVLSSMGLDVVEVVTIPED